MHPTSVAGYRIVEQVGRGGMGVVYRARDRLLERDVALKYLSAPSADCVDRLIREARVVSSLQHPGIVTIYGFVADGPCIAMEYVHGATLSSLLSVGAVSREQARQIGLELAEALHHAHRSGVVHADLKPANIMIDRQGRVKILDFGLARWRQVDALQTLSQSGDQLQKLAGTIPYMPPELLLGRSLDSRSDIFSLGCVLFELFTGHRPFSRETTAATLNALLNSPPAGIDILRARLPDALSGLVLTMLEKDPQRRPATLGDVASQLSAFCRGRERKHTLRSSILHRRPQRSWPLLLLALSCGVLLYFFSEPGGASRQLRVYIAQPELYRKGVASALDSVVWSSAVDGLNLVSSVHPVLSYQPPVERQGLAKQAKLAGSDEWIYIEVQPENPLANVKVQRVRTSDGALLKQASFHISDTHFEQSANAVMSQVVSLYGGVDIADSIDYSSFSEESYQRFVEIYSSLNRGVGDRAGLLEKLLDLVDENPGFLAAEVLAVDLSHAAFSDTGDDSYVEVAKRILYRLERYHPNSILIMKKKLNVAIDSGDLSEAERVLQELNDHSPGSPRVLVARAQVAEHRGELKLALKFINEAASSLPMSWRAKYRAAAVAIRVGDLVSARRYISEVLDMTPGNTLALGQLGLAELLFGDVNRAIHIYDGLLERKQHRSYLVNLGLAYMLKGEVQAARESFLKAYDIEPDSPVVIINLADAEMAVGNRLEAVHLYREILEDKQRKSYRDAVDIVREAQCLAHLGEFDDAVERVLEALVHSPNDPEIAYQAALVYALAGESKSALINARAALRGGMDNRWFNLPVFSGTPLPALLEEEGLL